MNADIISLSIFLLIVFVTSSILNTYRLVYITKIKKKYSSDYIRGNMFIMNIVFTLVAIPYYLIKEAKLLEDYEFICKTFYAVTDFIMFIYNNLLILMAFDRFCYICTSKRFPITKLFKYFYTVTLIIASSSFVRLLANNCHNHLKNFNLSLIKSAPSVTNNCNSTKIIAGENWLFRENMIILYNYAIIFVISINWMVTAVLYSLIIKHVYRHRIRFPTISIKRNVPVPNLQYIAKKRCAESKDDSSNSLHETSLVKESLIQNITVGTKKVNTFSTKSKHWCVTKTFIKVNFLNFSLLLK